ncbi:hypothetical protein TRIUR3_27462 [Triticum urartu]|uniref:Uncharacterized protein n=1 Tax=Triticum urartu TaxID=4572 RepID=M7YMC6_TRIUA|nr:hypothetical protein TRIUR3_27462 [Triticum urartu]
MPRASPSPLPTCLLSSQPRLPLAFGAAAAVRSSSLRPKLYSRASCLDPGHALPHDCSRVRQPLLLAVPAAPTRTRCRPLPCLPATPAATLLFLLVSATASAVALPLLLVAADAAGSR